MPKKKKKVGGGNLGHLVVCLSGRLARKHSVITQDITKNGGQCTKSVTQNVTHLVSTSEEVHRQTLKVTKAQNFNIPIVNEVRPPATATTFICKELVLTFNTEIY